MSWRVLICLLITTASFSEERVLVVKQMVPPQDYSVARMARIQGTVKLDIEIDRDGRVIDTKASSGHPLLQQKAVDNIKAWTFRNFGLHAKFPYKQRISYSYRLEGGPRYRSSQVTILRLPDRVEIVDAAPAVMPD
jgi:TonB family protein